MSFKNSLAAFDDAVRNFFGVEKPFTAEEKKVIGMEVSNALQMLAILSSHILQNPASINNPMSQHVDRNLFSTSAEGSVSSYDLAQHVDSNMTVGQFIAGTSRAFDMWPYLLTKNERPTRRMFSDWVKQELFKTNQQGWNGYVQEMRAKGLSWFGQEDED